MSDARLYPARPILAASLAVFRNGRVLLASRAAAPYREVFTLPGGVVETGETLEEACVREVEEETGVRARVIGFNDYVEFIERDETDRVRRHFVIASFVGDWISGEGEISAEAAAVLWVGKDELSPLQLTPRLAPILERAWRIAEQAR